MKVITRTFRAKPLTILLGHEESDLVFVVNQVAEVCNVTNPSAAIKMTMDVTGGHEFFQLKDALGKIKNPKKMGTWGMDDPQENTWMASSAGAYRMLLRSDSEASPHFRGWLEDDVLPEVEAMGKDIEITDSHLSEVDQLKAHVQHLERRLSASFARERRLSERLKLWDKNLVKAHRVAANLRKGQPEQVPSIYDHVSFLEKVQGEFDALSHDWLRTIRGDQIAIVREHWYEDMNRTSQLRNWIS